MLKVFDIFDFNIKNIAAIHRLKDLKRLNVATYCSTKIDFAAFPFLESCAIEWRPKAKSLFDCVTLKRLFANRYKGRSLAAFGRLVVNLESLAVLNCPTEDLQGIKELRSWSA